MLTEVFDRIISTVDTDIDPGDDVSGGSPADAEPAERLRRQVERYAAGVSRQRQLMAVFVREVHQPRPITATDCATGSVRWSAAGGQLLAGAHPDWSTEEVRTAVHGVFGMLNTVGTFESPLANDELADVLADLAIAAFQLPPEHRRVPGP